MKLTLTREQIPMARETVAWLRSDAFWREVEMHRDTPGFSDWLHTDLVGAAENEEWADVLEAAITALVGPRPEAEGGKDVDPRQPGPVSDADERAFWREVFVRSMPDRNAAIAADEADAALARYRKAFCAGMPSDQKGSDR